MTEEGVKHKFTASLDADVECYSRLTVEDVEAIVSTLKTYLIPCFNFNPGILLNIKSTFAPGAVFRAPFSARLTHHLYSSYLWIFPSQPDQNQYGGIIFSENKTLDMPMFYKNAVYDFVHQ